jgi:hypothetical protein
MEKSKKNKLNQAINFIEELSWLIERKKDKEISLKEISNLLRELIETQTNHSSRLFVNSKENKSNSHYLVGVLPELFQDEELFKSTEELLDFAETVLQLSVSRASKRSRTEYIGWIICEITKLNDNQLYFLVNALEKIVGSDIKIKQMKEAKKKPNFSWNETILMLSKL